MEKKVNFLYLIIIIQGNGKMSSHRAQFSGGFSRYWFPLSVNAMEAARDRNDYESREPSFLKTNRLLMM